MRNRIKTGDYQFPDVEWQNISQQAKSTIEQMLTVTPANRITISEILKCSWFTELNSARLIDMSPLQDPEIREQLEAMVISPKHGHHRTDDDLGTEISGPESSRLAKRAIKRKEQIGLTNETVRTMRNKSEHDYDENSTAVLTELKNQSDLPDNS
ncbi:unnamed protein product [Rotaria sp. Silwood2]|nr:unnamed protein product [Rotaria sp. Silwood2]